MCLLGLEILKIREKNKLYIALNFFNLELGKIEELNGEFSGNVKFIYFDQVLKAQRY